MDSVVRTELRSRVDLERRRRIQRDRDANRTKRCSGCEGRLDSYVLGCEICTNRRTSRAKRAHGR